MKLLRKLKRSLGIPANARWKPVHTGIASVVMATVFFSLTKNGDLSQYSDVLGVTAAIVGLIFPPLIRLCWRFINWALPQPGTRPFEDIDMGSLKAALRTERENITLATVPEHSPKANPATSARNIDLGDADLVVPESSQELIRSFIGHMPPRNRRSDVGAEDEILTITGEPGAGKSILLQEIHATISLGVENRHHSLIPLFIFARDLTLDTLEQSAKSGESPMRSFLTSYYEERGRNPVGENLRYLSRLVKFHWEKIDLLVIIDGLDEIAQRSAYEDIQKTLAQMILQDLRASHRSVHRYILSCRIDEDLKLFPAAKTLLLRGLTDKEREKFCRGLLDREILDRQTRKSLEELLQSPRLTPTHVFRRNPYFLALLLRHIREDKDRVRDRSINFEILMRKYLEREAARPYASLDKSHAGVDRREVFRELEGVSRACLQFVAFRSASSAKIGALYDDMQVDSALLHDFSNLLCSSERSSRGTLWESLSSFMYLASSTKSSSGGFPANSIHNIGVTDHLHENDIRLLYSLGRSLSDSQQTKLTSPILHEALGTIPYRASIETSEWYAGFIECALKVFDSLELSPEKELSSILFIRSIAAAQALRIIYVRVSSGRIYIRFRHRRLAEYYAACYVRDRWLDLIKSLEFSPWLGPVLNLTCALEGGSCHALNWLVDRIAPQPIFPYFKWRYSVEAAVEASFFAQPGASYDTVISQLVSKVVKALTIQRAMALKKSQMDAVTQLGLIRALEQISSLAPTFKSGGIVDEPTRVGFYQYEASASAEWISPLLPARAAIRILSQKAHPLSSNLRALWRVIKQPSAVLFPSGRSAWAGSLLFRCAASLSALTGEVGGLVLFMSAIYGLLSIIAKALGTDQAVVFETIVIAMLILGVPYAILRLLTWRRSPTRAATQAALLWRAVESLGQIRPSAKAIRDGKTQWRRLAIAVLGQLLLTAGIALGIAYLWPSSEDKRILMPCPDISDKVSVIFNRYTEAIRTIDPSSRERLNTLQQELRKDLLGLREANRDRRCGFETENGGWELSEERLADRLAKYDYRLVPSAPGNNSLQLTPEEIQGLQTLLSSDFPEIPSDDPMGEVAVIYRSWQADRSVEAMQRMRSRIVEARREGLGLNTENIHGLKEPKADIELANETEETLEALIEKHKIVQQELRKQAKRNLLYGFLGFVAVGMQLVLGRAYWQRRRDKRQLTAISQETNIVSLCKLLLDDGSSEEVRRAAIRQLGSVGVRDNHDLKHVEDVVGQLMRRSSETERILGISSAALVRTLSNRLRHRITTDAPLRSTPE